MPRFPLGYNKVILSDLLTLNEEEEADHAHGSDDEARYDEGHAPVGGDPVACDQRAQDVPHRGVGVPHTHDQTASVGGERGGETDQDASPVWRLEDAKQCLLVAKTMKKASPLFMGKISILYPFSKTFF